MPWLFRTHERRHRDLQGSCAVFTNFREVFPIQSNRTQAYVLMICTLTVEDDSGIPRGGRGFEATRYSSWPVIVIVLNLLCVCQEGKKLTEFQHIYTNTGVPNYEFKQSASWATGLCDQRRSAVTGGITNPLFSMKQPLT